MADAAYILFFAALAVGSAASLQASLTSDWGRIKSALRAEPFEEVPLAPDAGRITVIEDMQPALKPVSISICRL